MFEANGSQLIAFVPGVFGKTRMEDSWIEFLCIPKLEDFENSVTLRALLSQLLWLGYKG
jgi:hypothetical protein